jgi:hypothetical protein
MVSPHPILEVVADRVRVPCIGFLGVIHIHMAQKLLDRYRYYVKCIDMK